MYELKVKNASGNVIDFTTSNKYTVYKIEGLQPPAVTVSSSKKSTSDGSTINRMSVESRNIVIYVAIENDIEANRIELYKYFPLKQMVTVYFKNGARDVSIEGVVELIECDLFANRQVAQISLICPQPYFKAVDEFISTFNEISALFEFPFSIAEDGMEFSAISTNIRKTIINTGDVESGILINLYAIGTVVNPVIYNALTRQRMALKVTMEAEDQIVINTNVGKKSITLMRNGVSYNAMGYMTPDSKWLMLNTGDNVFTYEAESGSSNLQLTFTSSLLYGGV